MILLSQWYEPKSTERLVELKVARRANADSGLFKEIAYLNGEKQDWTYADLFDYAANHFFGEVCIVANTDIVFDDTASHIADACQKGRLLALTRWEDSSSPNMLGHFSRSPSMVDQYRFFSGTQDSWCFIGGGLPKLEMKVPMGVPGCDNVIAGWAAKVGCEVFNPALDIKTWHIHSSKERNHNGGLGGFLGYPELTTLSGTGLVAGHEWPIQEGGSVEWETIDTCKR